MLGCLAKVQVLLPKQTKLGPKTIDCVFIGYAANSATNRFLLVKSKIVDIHINTFMESIDVKCFECAFCNDPSPHLATILSALGLNTKNLTGGYPSLALFWEQHA